MEITTTIDIGVLEDGSVEEAVFDRIVSTIVDRISEEELKRVRWDVFEKIEKRINEKVDAVYGDLANTAIELRDKFGDKTSNYPNLRSLIKDRFDKYLNEKVDDRGHVSSYNAKFTRIEYFTRKQLEEMSERFTKSAVEEVASKIKSHLNEDLKRALGAKLVEVLDLNKLFKI